LSLKVELNAAHKGPQAVLDSSCSSPALLAAGVYLNIP
jgi:hypothetical protein